MLGIRIPWIPILPGPTLLCEWLAIHSSDCPNAHSYSGAQGAKEVRPINAQGCVIGDTSSSVPPPLGLDSFLILPRLTASHALASAWANSFRAYSAGANLGTRVF